jgi:acetolactate synthase-1/2/3 large subunit
MLQGVNMSKIDTLVEWLQESKRPLILMGAGARRASSQIVSFSENCEIPIETTWPAMDLIPWNSTVFVGRPGIVATRAANTILQECDLLISIGARLDPQTIAFRYDKLAPKAKKVLVDVDCKEAMKIPRLDLFIEEDACHLIEQVSHKMIGDSQVKHNEWLSYCRELKANSWIESDTASYQLCKELGEELTSDDVLVLSTTGMVGGSIFPAFFKQKKNQRIILSSWGLGSMGTGIPTAVGVSLASGKRVVCVDGDGSFFQNIQELEVVRRLNLNITFFVINNGGYASIRGSEDRAFGRHEEGMTFPNICDVAGAFGIRSISSRDAACFHRWEEPIVIEVVVPRDEVLMPRVNPMDVDGGLGNMWPYKENK